MNFPLVRLANDVGATSIVAVDLRQDSTPEDFAKILPDVNPVLQDGVWIIRSIWEFEPAKNLDMEAYMQDPAADLVLTSPTWINTEYGFETDIVIENVRIVADLVVPNTYPDPDTGAFLPCP